MEMIERYKELWNHMDQEHGLTLLRSQMDEIIEICLKFNYKIDYGECAYCSNKMELEHVVRCPGEYCEGHK